MPPTPDSLSCIYCKTPLRFRELPRGLTRFPCPECQRPLEIDGESETPQVKAAAPAEIAAERPLRRSVEDGVQPRKQPSSSWKPSASWKPAVPWQQWRQWLLHHAAEPLTVTWLVAGLAAAGLIIAVVRERGSDTIPQNTVAETEPPNSPNEDRPQAEIPERGVATNEVAVADDNVNDQSQDVEPAATAQAQATTETTAAVAPREDDDATEKAVIPQTPVVAARPVVAEEPDLTAVIRQRLQQKVVRFEQATPVPFDTMRAQVAELVAVPIWYDESLGDQPAAAEVPVQASLAEVTVGDVLDGFARQANLAYHVEPAGIRLVERERDRTGVATGPAGEL